jgi:hypothetical protein
MINLLIGAVIGAFFKEPIIDALTWVFTKVKELFQKSK